MKKNNIYLFDNEISLNNFIKLISRDKKIVLSICIICGLFSYLYGVFQPKIYKAEIVIRDAPSSLFQDYQDIQIRSRIDFTQQFNEEFKINLLSAENFAEFVETNNKINDFKNNLKKKKISVRNYFNGKFEYVESKNKKILNNYSLTYSESLPVENFLNDYIIFTKEKTLATFKKILTHHILFQIKLYQRHLKIAEYIDYKNPVQLIIDSKGVAINETETLFYKGTKVISEQLIFLNNLLDETQNLKLDYNPIFEKTLIVKSITKPTKIYLFIGLVLGLFFSFIIIFFKKNLNHKIY